MASVCPFSLASLTLYGPHEQPYCPALQSAPTEQAAQSEQADRRTESTRCFTLPNKVGPPNSSHDRAGAIPSQWLLPTQQLSATQQMQSTRHSHIPVNYGKFFSANLHYDLYAVRTCGAEIK